MADILAALPFVAPPDGVRRHCRARVHFRLALTTTSIGGVKVPAGTIIMLLPGAGNRDPRRFDDPHEFQHDRRNVREQSSSLPCQATDRPATGHHPISHLQTTGFCMHAALMSGSAPEHGRPFSWTQPGAMGGQGVPSGLTHACSGLA